MRKPILTVIAMLLAVISCTKEKSLVLVNESGLEQKDAAVMITRNQLADIAGSIPGNKYLNLEDELGNVLPYQLDDMNQDGSWDELFLVADMKPEAKMKILISWVHQPPQFMVRTNVHFSPAGDPGQEIEAGETRLTSNTTEISSARYQFEGPGWENDLVGFRNYYDRRNGIDIFGKKVSEMVLDGVGTDDSVSYHEMQPWGMDILKVGNSLGAGAIAMLCNDSLFRVGDTGEGRYRKITEGPLRSVIALNYNCWTCGGKKIDLEHRITIQAGKNWYKSTVTARGVQIGDKLVTGIVNMHSDTLFVRVDSQMTWLATHDAQAELGKYLGMALIIPGKDFSGKGEAPESGDGIIQTYYATIDISDDVPVDFYFFAGWEGQDSNFADREYFFSQLESEARKIANPVTISLK
jgi:hypothetical protein